jgi:hypothetical protein
MVTGKGNCLNINEPITMDIALFRYVRKDGVKPKDNPEAKRKAQSLV